MPDTNRFVVCLIDGLPFDNGWYFESDGDAIVLKDNNGVERARFS